MSNKVCCVPGCVNNSGSKDTLHKFPHPDKDRELFNTWVYSVGGHILGLENDHIFKYRRVCHIHFEEKYWCQNNRLSNIAVPTKHLPGLTSKKFTSNENSILRPIQNTLRSEPEASTSKGLTSKKIMSNENSILGPVQDTVRSEPEASTSKGLTSKKITSNENSILRPIQNTVRSESEASTSKGDFQGDFQGPMVPVESGNTNSTIGDPRHAAADIEMKENLESIPVSTHRIADSSNSISQDFEKDSKEVSHRVPTHKKTPVLTLRKKLRKRVAVTPAEQALYRKLVQVGIKLSKCRNKVKRQTTKIKAMKKITTNPQFLKTLDNLPSTAKMLTLMQFRETKKKIKGRRFTLQEKIVALSIFKQSPKAYRFLRRIFILPSPQTLIKLINMADIRAGINKNTIEQLKMSAEKMKPEHRLCVVLFDEMSLKPNLQYNDRKDRVGGFVTDGLQARAEFADHAQVFMVRGLFKNYKQPVAYTFSQSATKGPELAKQLKNVITEIQAAGLIVVATVCDQGTNNTKCYNLLIQETKGILLRKGQEPKQNIFLVNDEEIIPLYDPPHLIKCIRNNLITKDLQYKKDNQTKVAKWFHITCLHNENPGYKGIRLVPKLTDMHCIPHKVPRMKVKYATQVFSQTVASNMGYLADKGILPAEAKDTADVLLFFDQLFDSVNGSFNKKKKFGKPLLGAATPTSAHHRHWRDSKNTLQSMKFINKTTKTVENVPTLRNWVWTLDGIEILLKKLNTNYNVSSVWLRHLNQDPIENFFGSIRSHGCRNVNPTTEQFESAFTTLLINSLSSVHAPGANCELDNCVALHEAIITGSCERPAESDVHIPCITITPLEDKHEPQKIGGLQYVSGYFIKSAKEKIFKGCDQCKNDLQSENESEYLKYREYANKKWLHSPSDSLLCCVSCIQDINYEILKTNLEKNNLKEFIKTMILIHVEFDFIKCDNHKDDLINYLINISSRFFIHNYCKDINKILNKSRECDDGEDMYKLKAREYVRKTLKRKQ